MSGEHHQPGLEPGVAASANCLEIPTTPHLPAVLRNTDGTRGPGESNVLFASGPVAREINVAFNCAQVEVDRTIPIK
jgi:hypothetical protein